MGPIRNPRWEQKWTEGYVIVSNPLCAALCAIFQGQPTKYTSGFFTSILPLIVFLLPIFTEAFPTDKATHLSNGIRFCVITLLLYISFTMMSN